MGRSPPPPPPPRNCVFFNNIAYVNVIVEKRLRPFSHKEREIVNGLVFDSVYIVVRFFLVGRLWEFYNMKYVPYFD